MFRTLFESVLATVARDRVRHQTIRELQSLNDHLLADIGILRSEIPEFADSLIKQMKCHAASFLGAQAHRLVFQHLSIRNWQRSRKRAGRHPRGARIGETAPRRVSFSRLLHLGSSLVHGKPSLCPQLSAKAFKSPGKSPNLLSMPMAA